MPPLQEFETHHSGSFVYGLIKTRFQNIQSLDREMNPGPPAYAEGVGTSA
jgi:hypothetical protein